MLDVLLKLWWIQTKRDFTWKKVFIGAYIAICMVAVVLAIYFGFQSEAHVDIAAQHIESLAVTFAFAIIIPDLFLKIWWRNDPVEADDYLRTRPISNRTWSRFVLFTTATSFLTWMIPLIYMLVDFLLMPFGAALLTFVLMVSVSFANALMQNCWKRASNTTEYTALLIGYLLWFAFGIVWLMVSMCFSSLPQYYWIFVFVFVFVNIFFCACLQYAFGKMKNYLTGRNKASKVHSWGDVSLFSIEYVSILRCRRLRVSLLFVSIIFIMNVYLQFAFIETKDALNANLMLLFAIAFPSVILGQWVLGVEANYFHFIWSKPYPVEVILRNKFYFFCLLSGIMALLSVPAAIWLYLPWHQLLATFIFSSGVFVLAMMPTCLFSSRMDLFTSAFFNYQGGNKKLNIYSFVILIPMAIYLVAYSFLSVEKADAVVAGLGLIGLALHKPYLNKLTEIWKSRRYAIMERWMQEK